MDDIDQFVLAVLMMVVITILLSYIPDMKSGNEDLNDEDED